MDISPCGMIDKLDNSIISFFVFHASPKLASNSLYENFFITFAGTDCQIRALPAGFGNPAKPWQELPKIGDCSKDGKAVVKWDCGTVWQPSHNPNKNKTGELHALETSFREELIKRMRHIRSCIYS
jgi:hypothetical protein